MFGTLLFYQLVAVFSASMFEWCERMKKFGLCLWICAKNLMRLQRKLCMQILYVLL